MSVTGVAVRARVIVWSGPAFATALLIVALVGADGAELPPPFFAATVKA